jgi:predicted O-methyltransferase YrrM
MYSATQLGWRYFQHWWRASNGKGHGVHSPFVFDFITRVLNDRTPYDCYPAIEGRRRQLLNDKEILTVHDFGAGSHTGHHHFRKVREIAASALKPRKYAQLLHRVARHYQCQTVVELGTSLGTTSAYLASSPYTKWLHTFDGADAVARVAADTFKVLGLQNIHQVTGPFDETFPRCLPAMAPIDLLFIDGNHRFEPTLRYFDMALQWLHNYSIVVFDDVHWSAEMEAAWKQICCHEKVQLSLDLFFMGIVFFRKEFRQKQHFSIRY